MGGCHGVGCMVTHAMELALGQGTMWTHRQSQPSGFEHVHNHTHFPPSHLAHVLEQAHNVLLVPRLGAREAQPARLRQHVPLLCRVTAIEQQP